jgi:beta-lactam-binding protein with PASTA domain
MSLKDFIFSRLFAKHLGIAIASIVGGVIILLIWLNFYTRHGQARPIPDFVGLSIAETQALAKKHKLNFQIIDSVYTDLVPRGRIVEQNPKAGFKVKKWRNIVLIMNAFNLEMVAMPNLIDLPKRQALLMIENYGLEIGMLHYKPDLSIDVVLEQQINGSNINAGELILKGTVVDLVLGIGLSDQRTMVPYLIGFNLEEARNRILGASLNLGSYIFDNTVANQQDSINAFVYRQNPSYDDVSGLQLGSAIYLWFTTDSANLPPMHMMPDTIPALETIPIEW